MIFSKEIPVMKRFLQTACVGAAFAGFGATAQADSVQTVLTNLVGNAGGSANIVLNDADASLVLDSSGTLKTSGLLAVGDIFVGTLKLTSVGIKGDAPYSFSTTDQGMVGFYALKIEGFTDGGTPVAVATGLGLGDTVEAGSISDADIAKIVAATGISASDLAAWGFGGSNGDAMVAFFLDGDASGAGSVGDARVVTTTLDPFDFDGTTDGDLWASFGGASGTYSLTDVGLVFPSPGAAGGLLFDVATASSSTVNPLASVALSVSEVVNNTNYVTFNSVMTQDPVPTSNSNTLIGGGGGAVRSDISFFVNVTVPTPAAVFPGLALFGLAVLKRSRRLA